jgi:hypothetical protein
MPKVKITNKKGLVQEGGSGVELEVSPTLSANTVSKTSTLTQGGLFVLSASDGQTAITVTLPTAASVAGSMFIFRVNSEDAHILTGSDSGVNSFIGLSGALGTQGSGGKVTFPAVEGSSAAMLSDGRQYLVLNTSGTLAYTGYPSS